MYWTDYQEGGPEYYEKEYLKINQGLELVPRPDLRHCFKPCSHSSTIHGRRLGD